MQPGDDVDAVGRQVGGRVLDGGEYRTVTISRTYNAPVDDVWDACTNRERIPRWFLPVSGDLRLGGRYQLEGNAGGIVERCDPPSSFRATWEFGGQVSWIELRLSPEPDAGAGDRTRLELEHIVPADGHWDEYGPGAVGVGWDLALFGLGLHVPTGEAVDRDEAAAWLASAEGQAFVSASARLWGEAHAAGGADRSEAGAAAGRTAAAYTGVEPRA